MQEKNELNDIILNKGNTTNSNKKVILAVATLGVILIIVVMLMSTLTSNGTDNLPQAVLPPEPTSKTAQNIDEPLFEEVVVVKEDVQESNNLDRIAQKLKRESQEEITNIDEPEYVEPKITKVKKVEKKIAKQPAKTSKVASSAIQYFIQVGSFSKYEPNKKFLKSITDLGFNYKYHKVTRNSRVLNKVLVGPFSTSKAAKDARRVLRVKVEPGAFLIKL